MLSAQDAISALCLRVAHEQRTSKGLRQEMAERISAKTFSRSQQPPLSLHRNERLAPHAFYHRPQAPAKAMLGLPLLYCGLW